MQIEIESVSIRNFLSFGNLLQEIPFRRGVNLVLGRDQDTGRSNGSGKCVIGSTQINIFCNDEIKDVLSNLGK